MGNQQSGGIQLCSTGELYTSRGAINTCKTDLESRVGYDVPILPKFQVQRIQRASQQMVSQQQAQEDVAELSKTDKDNQMINVSNARPVNRKETESRVSGDHAIDQHKDSLAVYEGVFGKFAIKNNGQVSYTDINGLKHCEDFDRDKIGKVFPMGISYGGLTKSIWFKDGNARDEAFDMMISMPPSYWSVMNNPSKYEFEDSEIEDDEDMMTFDGINGRKIIVHKENIVLFTDIDENKHCVEFNKHNISKCFPFGIHGGGLPRTIWFNDEIGRDECFRSMRLNTEEPKFKGLYGNVVLHPETHIEYTSMSGDRVQSIYEPSEIQNIFPFGIAFGQLTNTIWFPDTTERNKCLEAMRKM